MFFGLPIQTASACTATLVVGLSSTHVRLWRCAGCHPRCHPTWSICKLSKKRAALSCTLIALVIEQVRLREADALRAIIRRREWEEGARRAFGPRAAASAVSDALAAAEEAGAVGTPLHTQLQERMDQKARWEARTAELLRADAPRVPRAVLEALLQEASAMGCRLAGLSDANAALDAAKRWSSRAAEVVELFAEADATGNPLPQVPPIC